MPPPALKSLAGKAGKSLKDAERYYGDAKKQLMKKTGKKEKALTSDDYRYIMGVVKKRLGLPTKKVESMSLAEQLIDDLVEAKLKGRDKERSEIIKKQAKLVGLDATFTPKRGLNTVTVRDPKTGTTTEFGITNKAIDMKTLGAVGMEMRKAMRKLKGSKD